jgi:hypothetical protein
LFDYVFVYFFILNVVVFVRLCFPQKFQLGRAAINNFDTQFSRLPLKLTPPDFEILDSQKGDEFTGFTYFNPHYETDVAAAEVSEQAEQLLTLARKWKEEEEIIETPPQQQTTMFPATAVAEPPLPNNNKFETCV